MGASWLVRDLHMEWDAGMFSLFACPCPPVGMSTHVARPLSQMHYLANNPTQRKSHGISTGPSKGISMGGAATIGKLEVHQVDQTHRHKSLSE